MIKFVVLWAHLLLAIAGVVGHELHIAKTGDYVNTGNEEGKPLTFAEPYKTTTLALQLDENSDINPEDIEWVIKFMPKDDEIWPEDQSDLLAMEVAGHSLKSEETSSDGTSTSIRHKFKLPGNYEVAIKSTATGGTTKSYKKSSKKSKSGKKSGKSGAGGIRALKKSEKKQSNILHTAEIRVAYARRDVIDLSPTDWDNYVDAIWKLKTLSSAEGKARYNCKHFYNIDVFTTLHHVQSSNTTCDQLHFNLLQEFAHHSWMTLLEKALQCVHPSVSMPFYNVAKDYRKYYDPEVGIKSMLDSPIFGPDYYGGGLQNWDDREDIDDPYYVEDGRFANFPLRQNRTELCDESAGLFDDGTYIPFCKSIMEGNASKGWRGSDPSTNGMWMMEPRDNSAYKYVSARRWYIYQSSKYAVGDNFIPKFVPTHEQINILTSLTDAIEQFKLVSNDIIHGYAHIVLSGMWGGGIDDTTLTLPTSQTPNVPILKSLADSRADAMAFAWADAFASRPQGCYKCTKEGCEINMEIATAINCYNIQNNFAMPTTSQIFFWTEGTQTGSMWYDHLERSNIGPWMNFALYGFGAKQANSGTFGRHAVANQDPMFYAHHAFTFLINEYGLENIAERGFGAAPNYGISDLLEKRGAPECPGNNPSDRSIFKNLVRYKVGQDHGSEHTWDHIFEMWSPDRRDYEWLANDVFLTKYDEFIRYDDSCVEGCFDTAAIIKIGQPPELSDTEICVGTITTLMELTGLSKEGVCTSRLKDYPQLQVPFLPDATTFYSWMCRKTCGYCDSTCG